MSPPRVRYFTARRCFLLYALDHCLLMLFAGTFTGFIESFVKAKGVVNFSLWTKRLGGLVVAIVGAYLLWQA